MSNKQAQPSNRVVLSRLIAVLEDGTQVDLALNKVDVVDRLTREPLFNYVLEQPKDGEQVMEVVQNGNWTGVRMNQRKPKRS